LVDKKEKDTEKNSLLPAVACLQRGGIVAIPTETYYGLAVDPYNEEALRALYHLKRRELHKPVLVLLSDVKQLTGIVDSVPTLYKSLMERFWPGPLTLIFPGRQELSPLLTGGTGTVGVRISSNILATQLCRIWGGPITATSANISGMVPAMSADDVRSIFGSHIDFIIDGGTSPGGACSTIVGIHDGGLALLREGQIDFSSVLHTLEPFENKDRQ
jgi:L-threonylcarbamoyladenylate synthase